MAELSEKDKRTLFGENYKEVLEKAEQEGRVASAGHRDWAAEVEKNQNAQFSAAAVIIVGGLIALSNYLALSGPPVMAVGLIGIAIFVVGAGWFVRLRAKSRELKATRPSEEENALPAAAAQTSDTGEESGERATAKPQEHSRLQAARAAHS